MALQKYQWVPAEATSPYVVESNQSVVLAFELLANSGARSLRFANVSTVAVRGRGRWCIGSGDNGCGRHSQAVIGAAFYWHIW